MNSKPEFRNSASPIEPLEPGRPDVMPNPQLDGDKMPSREGTLPLEPDDDAPIEEDMVDVDVNNSVAEEHPPAR